MPDDDAWEKLLRSRDYAGGFAARAEREQALHQSVLEALAERPDGATYEPLRIEGYSTEQIESAVYRLWRDGLVDAHSMKPKQVTPSALTTKGFRALQRLEKALTTKVVT